MPTWLRHKVRKNYGGTEVLGENYDINTGSHVGSTYLTRSARQSEIWDSGGNPVKGGHRSGGGYMRVVHFQGKEYTPSSKVTVGRYNQLHSHPYYIGKFIASEPDPAIFGSNTSYSGMGPDYNPTWSADDYALEAWNRAQPDKPSFDLSLALFELREVPKMLEQRFSKNGLKNIGDYFLALEFGWKPLFRDVRDFAITTLNGAARLKQLIRDQGRPVRRRGTLLSTTESIGPKTGQSYSAISTGLVTQIYRDVPRFEDRLEWTRKVWYSGRMRYWLPPGPHDLRWKANMYSKLFGLYPSPKTVYNAIPWSWLVDWFTDLGNYVEAVSGGVADRVACDYMYVMSSKTRAAVRTSTALLCTPSGGTVPITASTRVPYETKERTIVDPFGPSKASMSSLSDKQLAILGAIGLSNLPRLTGRYR